MGRNHRGFIEAVVACSKLGAHALFLNTSFSGPQLTDVAAREKPKALIFDQEFARGSRDAGNRRKRYIAWAEPESKTEGPDARGADRARRRGRRHPAVGAGQGDHPHLRHDGDAEGRLARQPKSLDPAAALLSRIPLKAREKTMIAAPLFHAWGFAHFTLGPVPVARPTCSTASSTRRRRCR